MTLHEIIGYALLSLGFAILIGGFIWNKMVMYPETDWF
jgi:hypothetical protein